MLLLLWITVLCATTSAHEHFDSSDIDFLMDAIRTDIEQHLNTALATPVTPSTRASEVAEDADDAHPVDDSVDRDLRKRSHYPKLSTAREYTENLYATTELPTLYSTTLGSDDQEMGLHTSTSAEESPESSTREHPGYPASLGYLKGTPGIDFPDYTDIPETPFRCSDQERPGFYADLDAECQVYHICWFDKRETFLCPVGNAFDQQNFLCDHWYKSNCSMSPIYYDMNTDPMIDALIKGFNKFGLSQLVRLGREIEMKPEKYQGILTDDPSTPFIFHHLPVKVKITPFPELTDKTTKTVTRGKVSKTKPKKPSVEQPEAQFDPETLLSDEPSPITRDSETKDAVVDKLKYGIASGRLYEALQNLSKRVSSEEILTKFQKNTIATVKFVEETLRNSGFPSRFYKPTLVKPKYACERELVAYDKMVTGLYDSIVSTVITVLKGVSSFMSKLNIPQKVLILDYPKVKVSTTVKKGVNISPLTKKALLVNYMNFLKLLKLKRY